MRLARAALSLPLSLLLAHPGCATSSPPPPPAEGPLAAHARATAAAEGLPADLLLAIAAVEGGLMLPRYREVREHEDVPVAGILELRRGAFDGLARGAALRGVSEEDLRASTDLGTEAGALVLRELAGSTDPAALRAAVATLSGLGDPLLERDYAARVYRVLSTGGTFRARDGETVVIPPHPEVPVGWTISPPLPAPQATPDSPVVTVWVNTPSSAGGTGKWDTSHDGKEHVAIHDTEGGWDASLATLKNDGGKSVQYMIDADGSRVAQFVPETTVAYHLGNYYYNQRSIGIEHVGKAADPKGYSTAMYDKSVALVKDITKRWKIPVDRAHIWGHYQAPNGNLISESAAPCASGLDACESNTSYGGAGHHTDPGYYWQWCQYMEKLGGTCRCNDAWDNWNCTTDLTQAWRCSADKLEKQVCDGPAKCKVMPIGTPDQCDTSGGTGAAGAAGSGAGGKAGAPAAGSGGTPAAGAPSSGGSAGKGGATSGGAAGAKPTAGGGGATAAAGSSGANAVGGTGGTAGGEAGAGGGPALIVTAPSGDSGSCATGGAPAPGGAWLTLGVVALAGARRRRRR